MRLRELRGGRHSATASDEVDDFELIALVERGVGPLVSGHDVAVEFDGDAVGFDAERLHQGYERERGRGVEGSWFPIDLEFHGWSANVTRLEHGGEGGRPSETEACSISPTRDFRTRLSHLASTRLRFGAVEYRVCV